MRLTITLSKETYEWIKTQAYLRLKTTSVAQVIREMLEDRITSGVGTNRIPKMEHNTDSPECWCNPTIQVMPNGNKLIIHNR
jgi:hypothetical protein